MGDIYTEKMAEILWKARTDAKKSQEYMAQEIGVSKMSIINWEKGVTGPKFHQFIKWFQVLGINVHRPLVQLIYPEMYEGLEVSCGDDKTEPALFDFQKSLPKEAQKQLLYILLGDHGSSPISLLQLFTAYLHLPMQQRVAISRSIAEVYEMAEQRGELVCPDQVLPNMDGLTEAIAMGKAAAIKGDKGYSKALD